MIEYITGQITDLTPASVVLECNGIGYFLNISLTTYSALSSKTAGKLFVYEAVREDAFVLYGFLDRRERELFLALISVSGVGPNTARMILSSLTPAELEQVIASGNVTLLKGVKGIGAKTAERIIVDLKDKIKADPSALLDKPNVIRGNDYEEAVEALVILGFQRQASQKVVKKLFAENPALSIEAAVKKAMSLL